MTDRLAVSQPGFPPRSVFVPSLRRYHSDVFGVTIQANGEFMRR